MSLLLLVAVSPAVHESVAAQQGGAFADAGAYPLESRESSRTTTHSLFTVIELSFSYDYNGNILTRSQTGGDSWSYGFNARNELLQVINIKNGQTLASFTYDSSGRRVKSVEGGTTVHYAFAGDQVLFEKNPITEQATKYIMAGGLRIAKVTATATTYYHQDNMGHVRVMTDAGRATVFQTDYRPFGEPYSPSGSEPYTYIGEFRDASISLNYFGERFYDPGIGRFVSMDPVLGAPEMPQSLNRYAYAANNPLKNADPSGAFFFSWVGAIVGAVVGAVTYTVTTLVTGQEWDWGALGRSVAVGAVSGALVATCGICGTGLAASILGGAAIGAGIGALGYAADRGIEYLQTGTLEWDWGQLGLSVGIGAAAGAAGGYLRWRGLQKPAATPVKGSATPDSVDPPGIKGQSASAKPKTLTVDDVLNDPDVLRTAPGKVKTPSDISDIITDAQSKGWTKTTLGKGSHRGEGLRLLGPDGATIRYNPGGARHFGASAYWYVARGNPHLRAWVGPWWTIFK